MSFNATIGLTGSGVMGVSLDYSGPVDAFNLVSGTFPTPSFTLTEGTGNLQAQRQWHDERTVAATTTDSIDLSGVLTDGLGRAVAAATIRSIVVVIRAPDGIKLLRVGPQNVASAAQLGFGGVTAPAYVETDTMVLLARPYGGWTITAGAGDLLPVHNPTAVPITYGIWITYTV